MASIDFSPTGKPEKDKWKYRRLFMLWQTVFCKIVIVYVLFFAVETKAAELALEFSFMLMGTIVVAYVFGATIEDIQKLKLRK